jgi:hypothetical protein
MPKPPSTWKAVESAIAKYWPGGKRRGADYRARDRAGGKNDVITEGWSVEIKHSKRPTWGLIVGAVRQARTNRENVDDIPVAVIHKAGTQYGDSLVVMLLSDFKDYFINNPKDDS